MGRRKGGMMWGKKSTGWQVHAFQAKVLISSEKWDFRAFLLSENQVTPEIHVYFAYVDLHHNCLPLRRRKARQASILLSALAAQPLEET